MEVQVKGGFQDLKRGGRNSLYDVYESYMWLCMIHSHDAQTFVGEGWNYYLQKKNVSIVVLPLVTGWMFITPAAMRKLQ